MKWLGRALQSVGRFIVGGGFPTFTLSLVFCWEIFLIGMLILPSGQSGLGAFAEDFRIWCFGYDPATGRTEWAYVMAMLLPQLLMSAFVALFWWEPLRATLQRPRQLLAPATVAMLVVIVTTTGFAFSNSKPATGELPFPAEEIRTRYRAPDFVLTNQAGEPVEIAALRGKVVMLTAVYASCGHTCPAILAQAKRVIADLSPEQRADLRLVAVTLDPSNDSREILARLASAHDIEAPLYNLVTGAADDVERVLDQMQVARTRNPETGDIDHANLFLLLDREGLLAYRLSLGERQERWLASALRVLLKEKKSAS